VHRLLGRLVSRIGVNWHVDLNSFLRDSGLNAQSVELVNPVVVCYK
jgi:hypothetical protein